MCWATLQLSSTGETYASGRPDRLVISHSHLPGAREVHPSEARWRTRTTHTGSLVTAMGDSDIHRYP